MRRIFLLLSFLLIISKITAEVPVAVIISGASPVNVGETKNYAAYSSTTIFAPAWTVTGGTIVNTGYDAAEMTYWANIQWDVVGNQTVNLKSKWLVVGSKAVTVNDPIDPPTANNESNKTTNSFRANWSNVSGASSYRLDVSVSSGFGSYVSGYQDLSVTGTNKTVSGLAVGKNYYYRVRAVGSSTSVNSNTITANTTISAPTANQESSKTTSSFKANWGSVSGAVSYRLDVSKFSNFQSFESGYNNLTVTGTNKTVSGLGSGKIYYYRVRARGSNITSGNSGIITANTTFQIPTVNSTSSITNDSFQANWTTSPLVACRLDVSEVSNFSSYVSGYQDILVSGTGSGTMQQTINGLVPGKNYYYRVRAIGPNVNSANSTTATTNTTISAPSPSEESNRTNLTFQANWISEPGAVSYLLDVSTDGSFSAYVPGYANKPVTGTSETVSGLSPGTNYYYRLEAVGSAVTSSHSIAEAAYTTISAPTASPEVNQTTTSFIANWGGVNGASSYQLDVSKSSNFTSYESGYQNLSVTGTGQTVGNLTSGKIYYFRVRAVGPGFTSGNSNTIMTNTIFPAPTVNVASAKTNDSFQANWTTSPLVACRLDVSEVSNFSSYVSGYQDILVSGGTGTMQQTINGLVPGKNYYYRVRAIGPNVNSANSTTATTNTTISAPSPSEESNRTNLTFQANWISEPGAVSYLLDVSTDGSFSAYVPGYANKPVTGTSETVSGLSPGTNYYYRLEAVGSAVTSSHSIAEAAYTTISAPTANPTSNDTYQSFQASWSSVSGAVSYELDVSTDVNFGSFVGAYFEYPVASPSTTVNGLNLCSTYYYRVRTVGPNSTSDDSNPITVTKLLPTTATLGTLTSDGNSEICPFSEITFTFSPGALVDPGLTYLEGEYNGSWHNYGSITAANTITVHDTEKFRVRYQDACNTIYSTELNFTYKTGCNFPSSLNKNFVRTEVPRVPISDEVALSQAGPDEKSMSYAYSDGLGRPTQSVAVGAGVGFSDVYSFNVYEPATGRQEKQYMPYLAEGGNNGAFVDDAVNTTTTFYQTELGESKPWSETEFENASSSKVVATTGVGAEWHDNNKNSGFDYYWNDGTAGTFDILKWEVEDFSADPTDESDKPKSTGTYNTANTLRFTQSTSVEGIVTRTATDLRGRKVVSQVLYEGNWISTYTVYDDFNRVRFIIPPVAAEFAKSADLTDDQISGFLFQSIYDEYGRTIKSKAPGAGWNYQVYDEWGRPVLSQDAAQRVNNLWSFVKYDDWNREIMTGEKTYSSKTHENLINDFKEDVNTHERYEIKTSTSLGYTLDRTLPVVSENKILTVHYYDDYSFLTLPNWDAEGNDFTYDPTSGDVTLPATNDITIVGEATGSKVRILSNSSKSNPNNHSGNQWLNTILYLDDDGRIIQTIGENHLGGIDRISNQLNWQGQLDKMKVEHSTDILSAISLDIITRNIYDDHGNLVESYQKIGSDPEVLVGQYVYNKFGELVEKNLHSTDGGLTFLQSLDYSYTIRGWLDQINNAALTDDGTDDAAEDDLVGANYHYTTGTTVNGQTIPGRYDGSMVALEYSAKNDPSLPPSGGTQGGITAYEYDDQNRLSNTVTDAGAFDMSATYDENGNIQTLDRKSAGTLIDDLDYNYDVASNQLLDVSDQGGTEEGYSNFLPGTTTPVDIPDMEYAYDEAGNQTEDQNKGILVMGYNKFQRVDYIEFSDDTKIKNTYDASGNKLAKSVYDADDNLIGQVDYVGAIEYYNGEINQVMTDEGRAYKQNGGYFYEYFIRDHQMNNRLSFGVLPYRKVFLATMETERIPTETQDFAIDPSTRVTLNNHTPLGNESAKLNAVQSRMVGPAIALIISNGDHVDIEAYAKYTDGNWNASTAAGIAGAVVNALSGTPGGLASEASAALTNTLGAGTAAGLFSEAASTTEPDAYLQYMFFDDNYTFVRAGFIGVSPAGFGKYERLEITNGFDALQDGFLYIYVANETNKDQEVYFDDLKVTHESATANFKVSQINDFYPFGMPTTNSWRNEAYIDPGLLYQSSYAHYDSLTGYYDFLSRSYDPQLGRFFAMDPAGQFSSPYTGMGNVPQLGVDPDGESFIGALVLGALLFTETGYEVQKYILPVAVHVDLHLSSEQKGIGLDASVGIPKVIPVSYRAHAGATYYWEHYDDSYKGWETRHGGEWTFGGVVSFSGTTYNSGETSQTTNMITIGGPLANFKYENDFMFGAGEFFPGVPAADGGDRYRTAAARLKIGLFKAGFNLFTGDPGLDSDMRETFDDPDNDDRETYMASNGNDPDKYRAGVFYVGFGPFKIGRNSERIRNKIQNEGAHDAIGAPYFRWLNINPKWYLYLGSGTGNSLW